MMNALNNILNYDQDIKTNISPLVEISRQQSKTGEFEWYGFLNHSGQLGNGFFEPLTIHDITFTVGLDKKARSIKSLKTDTELSFKRIDNGMVEITLPQLVSYDIVLIEY